ncbi:MAG: molybdenum cofactor guanylyltransferase [Candidatus Hodarchaeota archaeon]
MPEQQMMVSILAGGASQRFKSNKKQPDKALARINGQYILERMIINLAPLASRLNIITNHHTRQLKYQQIISSLPSKRIEDSIKQKICWFVDSPSIVCSGPLKGAITSMQENFPINITAPCDTPFLSAEVLSILNSFLSKEISTVVPLWSSGRLEPQIVAYRKNRIFPSVQSLTHLKRSRIDDLIRASPKVAFVDIEKTFSHLGSVDLLFANINRPEDLNRWKKDITFSQRPYNLDPYISNNDLQTDSYVIQLLEKKHKLLLEDLTQWACTVLHKDRVDFLSQLANRFLDERCYFWAGIIYQLLCHQGYNNFEDNQKNAFLMEMDFWEKHKIYFLGLHAAQDALLSSSGSRNDERIIVKLEKFRSLMNMKREDKK